MSAPQSSPDAEFGGSQRYNALCDRAVDFVLERGGAVAEDNLIVHVFGNAGSLSIWRPLLRSVLDHDPRVRLRGDGHWVLNREDVDDAAGPLLLDRFVALDVETTGLKAQQHRVIEIALIRFEDGHEVRRYASLVNPGRPVPRFITELTKITDADVAEAPPFEQIAQDVVDFIEDRLIVGHNVGFDIGFVNAELKRANLGALVNNRFDTLGTARRFLIGLQKPNLERVAKHLGIPTTRMHRAEGDAAVTAEVALRLAQDAQRQGVQSLDQLIVGSRLIEPEPREAVGRARSVMDRSMLADIPRKPGCYIMRDALEQVIYVGKSKNLRDRVASYFSQPLGYTRKMDGLLETVKRIETAVVGSEIEAMLLESQLIHRYAPRYNTAMRSFEHYPYIKVDLANPWPRVTVSKAKKDDGARYFGPYQSASGAKKTVETLNKILPLRTCTRSFKTASSYGNPCIQLGIGKCVGPCDGKADREAYRAMVNDVVRFLDGHESSIHERIWTELEDASARLDFERARQLRSNLLSMNGIVEAHKRMRLARERHTFLLVLPSAEADCREAMMIIQGRIWKQTRLPREVEDDRLDEEAARMAASFARGRAASDADVNQYTADERHILNRWLARNSEHPALLDIDETRAGDAGFWGELLRTALAFEDDDLVFNDRDVRRTEADTAEPDAALPDADSV